MKPNNTRDEWRAGVRDDIRDASYASRHAGWRIAVTVVLVVLFIGAISVGAWYFKVATSDVKGAGDATRQQNSAANRLNAQNKFNELYEGTLAADDNITTLAETAVSDKDREDLKGATLICRANVGDYNQMVSNQLTAKWIPAGLPTRLGLDAETDCKPDTPTPTPAG